MRITIRMILLTVFCTSQLYAGEKHAQSFMFTRPLYDRIFAKMSSDWSWIDAKKVNVGGQALGMYQKTNHSPRVDRYFLLNKQNNLRVAGDASPFATIRNVRAEWFGLPHNFSSIISMSPRQTQVGGWIELEQELGHYTENMWIRPFFVGIALPIQQVTNLMEFFERDITNPGTRPANMRQAFDRTELLFGKIGPQQKTSTTVPEVVLRFGSHMLAHERFVIDLSGSLIIPTQKTQDPRHLFSPFFGHNRHYGIGLNVFFNMPLNECVERYDVSFFIALDSAFFIKNKQYRSFDMKDNPWSRYMLLNSIDGTVVNEPAINILTRKCTVHPFNIVEFSFGFKGHWQALTFDTGYTLWGHGREHIHIKDPFNEVYGFAGTLPGTSASGSIISFQAPNDLVFVTLKNQNINLYSAESRSALSHTFAGAVGLRYTLSCTELIGGVGGFYEMVQQNASLSTWGVWAKIGVAV
jgi:hypothetical protein